MEKKIKIRYMVKYLIISFLFMNCTGPENETIYEKKAKLRVKEILSRKNYVTIMTNAFNDSLGDPSAGKKLIHSLKKSSDFEFIWLIRGPFKKYDMVPDYVGLKKVGDWKNLRTNKELKKIVSHSRGNIAFPTFYYITPDDMHPYLESLCPPFLKFGEYDRDEDSRKPIRYKNSYKTGLCKECLGIFLNEPASYKDPINSIHKDDKKLKEFLTDNKSNLDDIYFAYFANKRHETIKPTVNLQVDYLSLVILSEILKKKGNSFTVDIFSPLAEEQFDDLVEKLKSSDEASLNGLFKDVVLDYYHLNDDTQKQHAFSGNSKKIFRLTNPFRLNSKTMEIMFQISNSLIGVTGDQSFSEAIGNKKVLFYQALPHKKSLFKSFFTLLKEEANGNGTLVDFYENSLKNKRPTIEEILKLAKTLTRDLSTWEKQMKELNQYIRKNKILEKNVITILNDSLKNKSCSSN